ncbi:hypothetical protein KSB_39900 [Ktedonobacter robiniae]|uniref:Uncharacterized protein n=1 Tax=Ktedonobacter robiniae TaxID=2778365 RepID=A0ABQ3US34_9CHLR|nr:hypothetical protein KSB_39900 [Ktedonobacter robiniae]
MDDCYDNCYIELGFDKELPCVICRTMTNCGVAVCADILALTAREYERTWVLYPYCEQRSGCRDKLWEKVRNPRGQDSNLRH